VRLSAGDAPSSSSAGATARRPSRGATPVRTNRTSASTRGGKQWFATARSSVTSTARFETGDGLCTYGPCRGKVLDPVGVEVRENAVYLTDERFEACRRLR
jgi:hypothetical protein